MMVDKPQTVLVTGGSGYAGQFLVHALSKIHKVHYTYGTRQLANAPPGVVAHKVDLATGEGLREAFQQTPFHAVVNCAAISQPGVCESSPEAARAVNVPTHLVDCLLRQHQDTGVRAALIHFSTDQVYDGSHAMWKEDEAAGPVNVYGKTKLEAEQYILSHIPAEFRVAILRSSIIYGPPPPDPVSRALFLQFVASAVRGDKPTTFFSDEWRSPIYVGDLERLVALLIDLASDGPASVDLPASDVSASDGPAAKEAMEPPAEQDEAAPAPALAATMTTTASPRAAAWWHRVFNAGGPERLSRVDMARQVADALGCGHGAIEAASTATVNRGVASPADISMDVSRLAHDLGFTPTTFRAALLEIFPQAGEA